MGAKKQTIGYHYLFSILFGIGRGPVDELRAIKVSDKIAWEGHVCTDGIQKINKPNLFGGEKKEGGIQGVFRLQQGQEDQVLPGSESLAVGTTGPYKNGFLPDIKNMLTSESGGLVGELRGRVTIWFDGLVTSMNPYIKEWKFRIRRARKGWFNDDPWYPEKAIIFLDATNIVTQKLAFENEEEVWATVALALMGELGRLQQKVKVPGSIFAMNPAHMIYECSTNPIWARGIPVEYIDENSFIVAANTLCDEKFGLCLVWYRREEIDQFIQTIIDHIGAVLYTDRETGKVTLKLIRNDYDPDDLPLFTPSSGLLDVQEDDTGSTDTAVNEVIVTGHDPVNDEDIQMRAHNIGAFRAQGAPASIDQPYPGLPTKELCARVALRDLKASAAGLRRFKVVLDRRGFRIHPGAAFKIAAPTRGIGEIILRAGEVDDGKIAKGEITISAVQDVFGVPATSFVVPVENTWTPPSDIALPAVYEQLFEAGYRQAYLQFGASDANAVIEGDSYLGSLVAKPSVRSTAYSLQSRAEGEADWQTTGEHYFTSSAPLATDIDATSTSFTIETWSEEPSEDLVGQALLVGAGEDEEYMRIDAYDSGTKTFTVARGALDTWPRIHAAGTVAWLVDDDVGSDGRAYAAGETVEAKILPRTWSDALDPDDAALLTLAVDGRIARPYPPADVEVDGDSIYALIGEYPEPTFTWVERNRVTQADVLVGFFEATVAAEEGTTYKAYVYDAEEADVPIGEHDAITSGWQYDTTLQTTDGADVLSVVWVSVVAVRDGIESWSPDRIRVALKGGWGYAWGFNWGGAG